MKGPSSVAIAYTFSQSEVVCVLNDREVCGNGGVGESDIDGPGLTDRDVSQDSVSRVPHDNLHRRWIGAGQVSDLLCICGADVAAHSMARWWRECTVQWLVEDGVERRYDEGHHIAGRQKRRSCLFHITTTKFISHGFGHCSP